MVARNFLNQILSNSVVMKLNCEFLTALNIKKAAIVPKKGPQKVTTRFFHVGWKNKSDTEIPIECGIIQYLKNIFT